MPCSAASIPFRPLKNSLLSRSRPLFDSAAMSLNLPAKLAKSLPLAQRLGARHFVVIFPVGREWHRKRNQRHDRSPSPTDDRRGCGRAPPGQTSAVPCRMRGPSRRRASSELIVAIDRMKAVQAPDFVGEMAEVFWACAGRRTVAGELYAAGAQPMIASAAQGTDQFHCFTQA